MGSPDGGVAPRMLLGPGGWRATMGGGGTASKLNTLRTLEAGVRASVAVFGRGRLQGGAVQFWVGNDLEKLSP